MNGNTTASGATGYVYDFENHLVSANGITYVYDGDGHRISKTSFTSSLRFDSDRPLHKP
jgi:YD repeat-containing protein